MGGDEAFKLATSIITSLGGGTLIVFGLWSWLSKIWANKILEADKFKYQSVLEEVKVKHQSALDEVKRYSEKQFHLYNDLWSSLCDLQIAGDKLWEQANTITARNFSRQLQRTRDAVRKSSLLIEDEHYSALRRLLEGFGNFDLGKARLLELRRNNFPLHDVPDAEIQRVIEQNRLTKEAYSTLLTEIERYFKGQIRGTLEK